MGAWSDDIFGNDLACDVRDHYHELRDAGDDSAAATQKTKRKFAYLDADEKRMLWIALAATQVAANELMNAVREQALKAIAWCENPRRDAEEFPFRLAELQQLRQQLGGESPPPRPPPKPKVAPGNKGDVLAMRFGHTDGEAIIVVVGFAPRGSEYGRIVLLPNLKPKALTIELLQAELVAWRFLREVWPNSLGRMFGIYDAHGKFPARKCRLLFSGIAIPAEFELRQPQLTEIYRSTDLPYQIEYDMGAWSSSKWAPDPSSF